MSDCGVVALDYTGTKGIATSIGHAPQIAIADAAQGSIASIAEALTNIAGAPLTDGLKSVSLSANWMWPCRNEGEDAALYRAVEACSDFACALGINIPTGKDSLSMTQKYGNKKVKAPGTVIISAAGEVSDVKKSGRSCGAEQKGPSPLYVDFSNSPLALGGSAFAQSQNSIDADVPRIASAEYFANAFNAVQQLVDKGMVLALHDVSAGGLITTLLEMTFANVKGGLTIDLNGFADNDIVKILFAENSAIVMQIDDKDMQKATGVLDSYGIRHLCIGKPQDERALLLTHQDKDYLLFIDYLRDIWFESSYLLDRKQSGEACAKKRFLNYKKQPIRYRFPKEFKGTLNSYGLEADRRKPTGIKAAIIREKRSQWRSRNGLFPLPCRIRCERRAHDRSDIRTRNARRREHDCVLRRIFQLRRAWLRKRMGRRIPLERQSKSRIEKILCTTRHAQPRHLQRLPIDD